MHYGEGIEERGTDHISDRCWSEDSRTSTELPGAALDSVYFIVGLSFLSFISLEALAFLTGLNTSELEAM